MSTVNNFDEVFQSLRDILASYEKTMVVLVDSDQSYYLNTAHVMKNKKPLFFAGVEIKKNYVSYHLMPVYVKPALLERASARLLTRMQGKSCFNFNEVDQELFTELKELTATGYQSYVDSGYMAAPL